MLACILVVLVGILAGVVFAASELVAISSNLGTLMQRVIESANYVEIHLSTILATLSEIQAKPKGQKSN